MQDHVKRVCSAAYFHLHNISAIRRSLDKQSAATIIHALVTSRLDMRNSLLYGIPAKSISKFQRVQNFAARILTQTRKYEHITPVLKALHWLPVAFRIQYKILLFVYKCRHGLAPAYLEELISEYVPGRRLRSADSNLLCVPRMKLKRYGERAFAYIAPFLWNKLPQNIRNVDKLEIFIILSKVSLFAYEQH